ncbi:MAG: hypothetical protein [Bacteriophage sp.]|nr:MAG: hypothetical protein [Bacteriophage sp.]
MKIKFNPNPTFKAVVKVPSPGDDSSSASEGEITFDFRHLKTTDVDKIHSEAAEKISGAKTQADVLKAMAGHILKISAGWDICDEDKNDEAVKMDEVSVAHMLAYYPGMYTATLQTFSDEYWNAKAKI